MAGRGPAPKLDRNRRSAPARGEWQPSPDGGWQHELPAPPVGISPQAQAVWSGWFQSWWAAHWTPDDLPTLRLVIRMWDRVDRGDVKRAAELRQWLDGFGITPKGQQDRRWVKPPPPRKGWASTPDPYAGLRVATDPKAARVTEYAERRRTGDWAGVNANQPSRFRELPPTHADPRLRDPG